MSYKLPTFKNPASLTRLQLWQDKTGGREEITQIRAKLIGASTFSYPDFLFTLVCWNCLINLAFPGFDDPQCLHLSLPPKNSLVFAYSQDMHSWWVLPPWCYDVHKALIIPQCEEAL